MNFYVIRVKPRGEKSFAQLCQKLIPEELKVHFPRRRLTERKQGVTKKVESPLFPGYVFLEIPETMTPELYHRLRKVPGYFHILKPSGELKELKGHDLELVKHFLQFGQVMEASKVVFDENQRIRVLSGPMSGLEGKIVSVDRRKGRAKIILDFDRNQFTINLAFEVLEAAPTEPGVSQPPGLSHQEAPPQGNAS